MIASIFRRAFTEQVDYFRRKLDLPTERWDDIAGRAHDRAFIVAGAARADLLADLHEAVDKAIADGGTLEEFRRDFAAIVQRYGWDYKGGFDWRTRVIYQTNLRASHAAGRWAQLNDPILASVRPYWRYIHSDSVMHPRPLHLAWNGLVLHREDPWWRTHFPPNGWGCRCTVQAVDRAAFDAAPMNAAPDDGTWTHIDSRGQTHTVPQGIDYGWDHAPGAGAGDDLRQMIADKLLRYPPAIARALADDIANLLEPK